MKKWNILNKTAQDLVDIDSLVGVILQNRGITAEEDIRTFLHPKLEDITPISLNIDTKELQRGVDRVRKAIEGKESIVVYTDYDVDGICAGAIVWETLYALGANIMPHVPHRVDEGYGLSHKGIIHVKGKFQASLIITVDHGIVAHEEVDFARSLGIDVILTDHHTPSSTKPKAHALIHTTQLSGSGVAWFFAKAIRDQFTKRGLNNSKESSAKRDDHLELAAIATISDLVSLIGPNRAIVKHGLDMVRTTTRVGLLALIEESGLTLEKIGTYEVGHVLAPRINAMGRLTHAIEALRLLCTKDNTRAHVLAQKLGLTNKERQELTQETVMHAKELLARETKIDNSQGEKLIFLHHTSFNQGIIGLVAGKLVEEHYRPAVVIAEGLQYSKASARSIKGFNIVEAIRSCGDLLIDCGGHPMAAGFTVETTKIMLLKKRLKEIAERELDEDTLTPTIAIDCTLPLEAIRMEVVERLGQLEPFGMGNPKPIFASFGVLVERARLVGATGNHLKLTLKDNLALDVIGFGLGNVYKELQPGKPIDIVYALEENEWNGSKRLQLRLKDVRIPHI